MQGQFSMFPHDNFLDLFMVQFGWEQCASLHSYGPHVRNNFLFHYIISGKGQLEVTQPEGGVRRFQLHEGTGFLILPGQVTTYCADQDDPWRYTWVEFGGVQAQYRLGLAGLTEQQPIYSPIQRDMAQRLQDELLYIANNPQATTMNLMAHFYLFMDALIETSANKQRMRGMTQQNFYIREATQFIEQYYKDDIKIEQIAAFCGLNRTYFSRLFKEMLGETPQEYLARYRVNKSMEIMRGTSLSIGEIAAMVGYPNQMYFSKVLRKYQGVPPRTWRQQDSQVVEGNGSGRKG